MRPAELRALNTQDMLTLFANLDRLEAQDMMQAIVVGQFPHMTETGKRSILHRLRRMTMGEEEADRLLFAEEHRDYHRTLERGGHGI